MSKNLSHVTPNEELDKQLGTPIVYVVDDVAEQLEVICELVGGLHYEVAGFTSAIEFVQAHHLDRPGCAVIDVVMPDLNGLEVQQSLIGSSYVRPHILVSAHADVPMAVEVMSRGALAFLLKPFRVHEFLGYVQRGIDLDLEHRRKVLRQQEMKDRMDRLTDRERQVLDLVLEGEPNKRIAKILDISQRTVELHRSHVMKKMGAHSMVELLRSAFQITLQDENLHS